MGNLEGGRVCSQSRGRGVYQCSLVPVSYRTLGQEEPLCFVANQEAERATENNEEYYTPQSPHTCPTF